MKKLAYLLPILCLLTVCLLVGCTSTELPDETDPATSPDTTEAVSGEIESESETVAETETETEAETEYDDPALKLDHLTVGGVDIAQYTVVVSENPAPYDQKAAELLIRFIGEATGVTLSQITDAESAPHMILVGTTAHDTEAVKAARAEITADGYAWLVDGGNLYVTSEIPRGTLYGVYDLLETYVGVRLYGVETDTAQSPAQLSEMYGIKESLRVDIPADLRTVFNPVFTNRYSYWYLPLQSHTVYPFWGADNHLEVTYAPDGGHTIGILAETGDPMSPQPCLTDENIYQTVLKNVRANLAAYPNASYVCVSQNDGPLDGHGCQCENCLAIEAEEESPSGPWIRFVNRLAGDIKDEYPNVMVETYAYGFTEKPPKVTKPAENVAVRLCESSVCYAHALDDPSCPRNVTYSSHVKGWAEICDHLMIWSYTANFLTWDNGSRNGFGPDIRLILQNVQFYRDNHVKAFFLEGKSMPAIAYSTELGELRAYLWGKVLWNPNMTQEEFDGYMNDFMEYYYGDAAPLIRKYLNTVYDSLTDNSQYDECMTGHTSYMTDYRSFFHFYDEEGKPSAAFIEELSAIWREINALETLSEQQRVHADCAAVHFYDAAAEGLRYLGTETKDSQFNKLAKEYRSALNELTKRLGLS